MQQSSPLATLKNLVPLNVVLCLLTVTLNLQANSQTTHSARQSPGQSQFVVAGEIPAGLNADEWRGIRAQISARQYRAIEHNDGGLIASNPAHGWNIRYHKDGTTILTPREDGDTDYRLGFKLDALGYAQMQSFNQPQKITTEGNTVTYQWHDKLREYWVNSHNNLEQWFVLETRPEGATGGQVLELRMTLTGNVKARQNGNSLIFDTSAGTSINYNKLKVWDSSGLELDARMRLDDKLLSLFIDDANASYPLTIDPSFTHQAYLKPLSTDFQNRFGWAVAISGDTLVVGAPQWQEVSGNSGSVFVFVRNAGVWSQQDWLKPSNDDASADDKFGRAVAISGDTIVVGAMFEDSASTGVNGGDLDDSAIAAGAAYVFVRDGVNWNQQAYLKASNTESNDQFGISVGISGDTAVVGAWFEGSNATGVNGDQINNSALTSGAAYVFVRSGLTWSQEAYLKASNTGAGDRFGESVAISGDTLIIGAKREDSNASGVNGDQSDNSLLSGAAYVFVRSGITWSQEAYLKASNPDFNDGFGSAVAISDHTAIVGARREASNSTGINGNQADNSIAGAGAAYVFVRDGISWSQQAYLKASNTGLDNFGHSVSISGNCLVVGAVSEASNATGVDGDQTDDSAIVAGAAYVFSRSGVNWSQQAYLKASNTEATDAFGAVSVSGNTVLVGAYGEDSNATGVDGNGNDNSTTDSGAAYVYKTPDCEAPPPPPPPPPHSAGLNVRCLHEPIYPQLDDQVTITAEAIDENGNAVAADFIEIYVGDLVSPITVVTNQTAVAATVVASSGQLSYGCRAGGVGEDISEAKSWFSLDPKLRSVDVGTANNPKWKAIPVIYNGPIDEKIDIVLFHDDDEYTSFTDPEFLQDVHDLIDEGFFTIPFFVEYQWAFNFWIATADTANASPKDSGSCFRDSPDRLEEDYGYRDAGGIVHILGCRDNANPGSKMFTVEIEANRMQVFTHEIGHAAFGLADEYCTSGGTKCDGGYFRGSPIPNLFKTQAGCIGAASSRAFDSGDCRSLTSTDSKGVPDGKTWWIGEPEFRTGVPSLEQVGDLMQQTGNIEDASGNILDRYKVGNSEVDPLNWHIFSTCLNDKEC